MDICNISGCVNPVKVKKWGWCSKHYKRWVRYGNPRHTKRKRYASFEQSFTDQTVWRGDCLIWTGVDNGSGYGEIWVGGVRKYAHRYAWEREHGEIPRGFRIDHKDHCNTLCCNTEHLRLATQRQNNTNKSGKQSNNTSGHRNVFWHKAGNKWMVRVGGKYFGLYSDIGEAALVAEQARKELFGEFAGKG